MKKRVRYLFVVVFMLSFDAKAANPVVSLTGAGVGGWGVDTDLTTTDGITYTISGLVVAPTDGSTEIKFRQDHDWTINWGAASWPSGTGTQAGANIPAIAGTYDVTFNITTGAYTFEGGPVISVVKLVGTATVAEGVTMTTGDGSIYKVTSTFTEGTLQFDIDGALAGGTGYPTGNADADTNFIPVPAGIFTVTFDLNTGDYSFAFPTVSLTGAGVGGWGVDTDLTTVDGVTYTINGLVVAASGDPASSEIKFRQDHAWTVSWGGAGWPAGTNDGINNIPAVDGTYNVTFNIITGEYTFDDGLSTKGFSSANFKVYPNPTQNVWNFNSTSERIESVRIVDVLGKNVLTVSPKSNNVSVDASILTKGIYFAKIATAKATETIKLMKN